MYAYIHIIQSSTGTMLIKPLPGEGPQNRSQKWGLTGVGPVNSG